MQLSAAESHSACKMWTGKGGHCEDWCRVGLVLSLCFTLRAAQGLNSDIQALLAFKMALISDPRSTLQSWNQSDPTPCKWTGVTCKLLRNENEPRVTILSLPKKQLTGPIAGEVGMLTYLQRINLHGNQLSGPLPLELFNATFLKVVYLFDNKLSGSLPAEIGSLDGLQYLDVADNKLVGSIPASILKCTQLVKLVLSNNILDGEIPKGLGSNLTNLQELDLSSNILQGRIPDDLGSLSGLRGTLNLSNNHLSGAIPDSLGKLPFNLSLDLRNNDLSGPIPLNGALSNQGPTAFLGNVRLCGLPLANSCPTESPPIPNLPTLGPLPLRPPPPTWIQETIKRGGLSSKTIAAVAIGDTFGIAFMGLIFLYCYWRNSSCKSKTSSDSDKKKSGNCCGNLTDEVEAISEKSEQGELVHFEADPEFDLEDLLKASAYVLGKRGSGVVYKAVIDNGLIVVVRRLGEGGIRRHKEFEAEAKLIGRIRHPNIVRLLAYYWSVEEKLLIYEFINNGSLAAALHGKSTSYSSPDFLPWAARLKIAQGVAHGLAFLHDFSPRKYVHGDIKPANILIDSKMEAYISDFGLSQLCNMPSVQDCTETDTSSKYCRPSTEGGGQAGSMHNLQHKKHSGEISMPGKHSGEILGSKTQCQPFQVPEALSSNKPTQKWDVYAFGLVLLELLTGIAPGEQALEIHQTDLVTWAQNSWEDKKSPSEIFDPGLLHVVHSEDEMFEVLQIALLCVATSPEQRPKMKHIAESLDKLSSNGQL